MNFFRLIDTKMGVGGRKIAGGCDNLLSKELSDMREELIKKDFVKILEQRILIYNETITRRTPTSTYRKACK